MKHLWVAGRLLHIEQLNQIIKCGRRWDDARTFDGLTEAASSYPAKRSAEPQHLCAIDTQDVLHNCISSFCVNKILLSLESERIFTLDFFVRLSQSDAVASVA